MIKQGKNEFEVNYAGIKIWRTKDSPPPDEQQIELAKIFIQEKLQPRKTFNTKRSSYGLKHSCERFFRLKEEKGDSYPPRNYSDKHYISNGSFIVAMHELGFKVKPDSLNAHFNIKTFWDDEQ